MNDITKITFYERTLDILINSIPHLSGGQLKCLLIIAFLTVKQNLHQVHLKLDQIQVLTGLSRKTVIKTLRELSELSLITINKSTNVYSYSLNRDRVHEVRTIPKNRDKTINFVLRTQTKVEQLYFEDVGFPPEVKLIFDLWNTYIHKWLDIHDEMHVKWIKYALKTFSVDRILKAISKMVNEENMNEVQFDELSIKEFFGYRED